MEAPYINIHQELIDACRAGDRAAQFKIYKLYYKAMYNTALRIVNDTQEAEDVMQESFLDAFRRLDGYTGEGSFGNWLKRIVVNNALDVLRKSREMISIEETHLDLPEEQEESRDQEMACLAEEVRAAIAKLPDDYRVVLSLFLLEGYDHEEISEILQISNNLSRTRFVRAKQKLVALLRETGIEKSYRYN